MAVSGHWRAAFVVDGHPRPSRSLEGSKGRPGRLVLAAASCRSTCRTKMFEAAITVIWEKFEKGCRMTEAHSHLWKRWGRNPASTSCGKTGRHCKRRLRRIDPSGSMDGAIPAAGCRTSSRTPARPMHPSRGPYHRATTRPAGRAPREPQDPPGGRGARRSTNSGPRSRARRPRCPEARAQGE
jgi:hypothetical protein